MRWPTRRLGEYKVSDNTVTVTLDPFETNTAYIPYTGVEPSCTIAETACTAIVSSWSSARSEWLTNGAPEPTNKPHCATDLPYVPCSVSPDYCFIYADPDKTLYYWPITTVSGDLCAQNGSTVFAEPTSPPEPNKVVVDGHTFTSPTNYLSFDRLSGVIHGQRRTITPCGPPARTEVVIPITESFYSRGYSGGSYSFNFADFNTIPTEAYDRQRKCRFQGECDIIEGEYTPIIPLPTEVLNLEDEWKNAGCRITQSGYYITTVALATPTPTTPSKIR